MAAIEGWQRRFWQGSHDHRGTPEAPGRVVTLVPAAGVALQGRRLPGGARGVRAPGPPGKKRLRTPRHYHCHWPQRSAQVGGILYVARADNHAYLGPAPLAELAAHIARSAGPSGSNRDYVLALADALRELDDPDPHVLALEALLLQP